MVICPRCREACGGRCAPIRRPSRRHFFFGLLGGAVAAKAAIGAGSVLARSMQNFVLTLAHTNQTLAMSEGLRIHVDAIIDTTTQLVASVLDMQGNVAGSAKVENGRALIMLDRPLEFGGFRIASEEVPRLFKFYGSRVIIAGNGS